MASSRGSSPTWDQIWKEKKRNVCSDLVLVKPPKEYRYSEKQREGESEDFFPCCRWIPNRFSGWSSPLPTLFSLIRSAVSFFLYMIRVIFFPLTQLTSFHTNVTPINLFSVHFNSFVPLALDTSFPLPVPSSRCGKFSDCSVWGVAPQLVSSPLHIEIFEVQGRVAPSHPHARDPKNRRRCAAFNH